ncbi:MAG: nitrilase-related carbon-nitrogen hydrolase [bacterium]
MNLAFIQFAPVLGDLQANINKLQRLIPAAAEADLLVLPELCNSGYNFTSQKQALETSETVSDSTYIQFLVSQCKRHEVSVVSGFNERDGDKLYNSAVLIGQDGCLGKYRKLHLFLNEKDIFQPGDVGLPVFDIGVCRLGILICFDWIFPEAWRVLALKGADIICHPSALVLPGLAQRAVPIHGLTNRVYTIIANRIGTDGELTFTGLSTIADTKGEVLAQASPTGEEVKVVEIDVSLARDKMVTPRNDIFTDRRPQEYKRLLES